MIKTVAIRPILNRLRRKNSICPGSERAVIYLFGEEPIVNRRNLRKAVAHSNLLNYRNFCVEWLGWPRELTDYLGNMEVDIVWAPTPEWQDIGFVDRRAVAREVHVAATLAWLEEMRKP